MDSTGEAQPSGQVVNLNPFTTRVSCLNTFLPARDKPLFIQHCHACRQASVAVLYEQRFVSAGRNELRQDRDFGSEGAKI